MKEFEVPQFDVVYFMKNDIITASCKCVDCQECPSGKDNCQCVDFSWQNG